MKIRPSLVLLELLIMMVYLNPVADLFPSAIQIVVFVLWAFAISFEGDILNRGIRLSSLSILIMLVTFVRCVMADQLNMDYYSPFQVVIQRYQFVVYPMIFIYTNSLKQAEKYKVFKWALLCITGTVLVSLYYVLRIDPQAIRNTQGVNYFGVGDFQLMYAMSILFGPLLFLLLKKIHEHKRWVWLAIVVLLMAFCLVLCNLVTSVVIAMVSVTITYILTRRTKLLYVLFAIIIIACLSLRRFFAGLLYALAAKNLFYWSTNNKIIAIANVLMGSTDNIDTLSRRSMLAGQSLQSFKENPIFGIDFKNHVAGKIGCHCQWADDLGRFGILGNVFIVYNYVRIVKYTIKNSGEFVKKNMISAWICFFILGFLNPNLSGTILMAILVVIPTFDAVGGDA